MTKIYTGASVSIDGFISGPGESGFEHLFAWYGNGDIERKTANPELTLRVSKVSNDYLEEIATLSGALVVGRKLFDAMNGWGGRHPMDVPTVVLTHNAPSGWDPDSFVFVTTGIEDAVAKAKELAGERNVGVNGGTIASQCLDAGLLDEIWIDLVPVLLGGGTPYFSSLSTAPVTLDGPYSVAEGNRVTHLRYRVSR